MISKSKKADEEVRDAPKTKNNNCDFYVMFLIIGIPSLQEIRDN